MRDLALGLGFHASIAAALFFAGMVRFVWSIPRDEYEHNRQKALRDRLIRRAAKRGPTDAA